MFEFKFKFIILWKILPALVALLWCFPRVCWHVAFKMTFVVKALSLWLQLLQKLYFQISCKFIWLILRKCFEMQFKFIILWKKSFLHWLHGYGVSPVCVIMWRFILLCVTKNRALLHTKEKYQITTLHSCLFICWHIVKIIYTN